MLTNIYFVRHAHSTYTPDELSRPLSAKGFADAEKVCTILETQKIDLVISSPFKRAIQTVEGVAECIGSEMIIEEDVKERILAGTSVEDFELAITKVWEEPTFFWEGGESNVVAQDRGARALLSILEKYEGKNIVIGTHGNIMVLIMNYFDKKYDFNFWKELDMPDIYQLTFDGQKLKIVNRVWDQS